MALQVDLVSAGRNIAQNIRQQSAGISQNITDIFQGIRQNEEARLTQREIIANTPGLDDEARIEVLDRFDSGNKAQRESIFAGLTTGRALRRKDEEFALETRRVEALERSSLARDTTAQTTAETKKRELDRKLLQQQDTQSFAANLATSLQARAEGQPIDPEIDSLLNNPQIVRIAQAAAQGLPITSDMIDDALKSDPQTSFQFKSVNLPDGMQQQQLFNPKTGVLTDLSLPITVKQVPGRKTPTEERTGRREEFAFKSTSEIFEKTGSASGRKTDLKRMLTLLDEGTKTGFGQAFLNTLGRAGRRLGFFEDVKSIDNETQFLNIQGNLLADRFAETKGSISEAEVALFERSLPGMRGTPEGNRRLLNYLIAASDKSINVRKEITRLRKTKMTDQEVDAKVNEFILDPKNSIESILAGPGVIPGDAVIETPKADQEIPKFTVDQNPADIRAAFDKGIRSVTLLDVDGTLSEVNGVLKFTNSDGTVFDIN